MKKILFITWDSDRTNYLESLFFPVFTQLQTEKVYQVVVLQFSWASTHEIQRLQQLAAELGISYLHHQVHRKLGRALGTLRAVWQGSRRIKHLISEENISILMPRSTLPAWMVNRIFPFLKKNHIQLLFDADGFPIQERIDFSGLNPNGLEARLLQFQENQIIRRSDALLTRSNRAKSRLLQKFPKKTAHSFFTVSNGRNPNLFFFDPAKREQIREELNIQPDEICWIYVGSLGPAYAYREMLHLFDHMQDKLGNMHFLFLPNDLEFAQKQLFSRFPDRLIIKKIPFAQVPGYLSAADFGISFRTPAPSLEGLFPVKLGEYLLCGLPVFASREVGDTMDWISQVSGIFGVDLQAEDLLPSVLHGFKNSNLDRETIRNQALPIFSLDHSVSCYKMALHYLESQPN